MGIPIIAHIPSREKFNCSLSFTIDGPRIDSEHEEIRKSMDEDISFTFVDASSLNLKLSSQNKIKFKSMNVQRKYSAESLSYQEMYPPSAGGWITHLSESGEDTIFTIQEILGKEQYLLSIVDMKTEKLQGIFQVHSYEINILLMETDWERYNRVISEIGRKTEEISIEELLNKPAPPWEEITPLIEGINIPNLQRGKTTRDTMNQFVPKSFPEDARLEIMAFLSYISQLKIPKEDPLDFQMTLRKRFHSSPLLRILVYGHIQCLVEGVSPPQYVRLMTMADRGLLRTGLEPAPSESDMWSTLWYRLMEMFPNRKTRIASIAQDLNTTQEILTSLPISKEEARISKDLWLDRFSLVRNSLMMRGYIQDHRIGLVKLAFVGGTHRWPHKHLAWSARLGNPQTKPPFIQIMSMPIQAAERITRMKPKISRITWSASKINYNLYNPKKEVWKTNLKQIINSFSGSRKIGQLDKEFGFKRTKSFYIPSLEEARVLDLLSWGIYLQSLEVGNYDNMLNISRDSLKTILMNFQKEEILQFQYFSYLSGMASVCLEIKGKMPQINSVARSCLKHMPSATVMLSEKNSVCYVLGRVPESIAYDILVELPTIADDLGLQVRAHRMMAFAGYVHNLYQRLLKEDGTWDDDVSGILSQIRT